MSELTICRQCKHCRRYWKSSRISGELLYVEDFCFAAPISKIENIDYVTGKTRVPSPKNFSRCREINTCGKCSMFEKASTYTKLLRFIGYC